MPVLEKMKNNEYPEDYLTVRLISRLAEKRFGNVFSEKVLQSALAEEMRWLFCQMNSELRKLFFRIFVYFELKNIFNALRFRFGGSFASEDLLNNSLLSEEVKHSLVKGEKIIDIVDTVSRIFCEDDLLEMPLKEVYLKGGLKDVERHFIVSFLNNAVRKSDDKVLKLFFRFKVDERNIITVYKALKWDIKTEIDLIDGGEVSCPLLYKILEKRDTEGLIRISEKFTGIVSAGRPLEDILSEGFTNRLKRVSKHVFGRILILYYIWKLHTEARERRKVIRGGAGYEGK
ncbi:MAG: hypothetical protein OHK0040_01710 [bacterium]